MSKNERSHKKIVKRAKGAVAKKHRKVLRKMLAKRAKTASHKRRGKLAIQSRMSAPVGCRKPRIWNRQNIAKRFYQARGLKNLTWSRE